MGNIYLTIQGRSIMTTDITINELVINFHMTETCNYSCGYCYAAWNDLCSARELHHHDGQVELLLKALAEYYLNDNPLAAELGYKSVRINFAGGEPMLLGPRFLDAVTTARHLGFNTSIITNAHFLDEAMLEVLAPQLSILGISYDSANQDLATRIGRVDRKQRWITPENLIQITKSYRQLNPAGIVKLNTVVNAYNFDDDMQSVISAVQPDKWKLLRVLPVHDHQLTITAEQYRAYVERHVSLSEIIAEEDNTAMQHSYLMINPKGCFYQNGEAGTGYQQSPSILDIGVAEALAFIPFDITAFSRRYQIIPTWAA